MEAKPRIAGAAAGPLHQTIIEPRRGWHAVNWGEIWNARELLYFFAWRDIKVRYKQTALGFLWAVIQPFGQMVVFTLIFGQLAKMGAGDTAPYPILLYSGLLPWQFFSSSLNRCSQAVVAQGGLVTKVYFPRLLLPFAEVGGGLLDFAISFGILIGLMLYYHVMPTTAILMAVPLTLLTVLACVGTGTLLCALVVVYRDLRYVIPYILSLWMFLTPVIYPVSQVPKRFHWVLNLNPMSGVVDGFRSAILGRPFPWSSMAVSLGVSVAMFFLGVLYFRRTESRFADIV